MRQGGRPLNDEELKVVMLKIAPPENWMNNPFRGLEGIDAENTAPYFDDALESLVQQFGLWTRDNYDIDREYNRTDLRQEAIRRALWAILVIQGYTEAGERGYGEWFWYDEEAIRKNTEMREAAHELGINLDRYLDNKIEFCPVCQGVIQHVVGCPEMDRPR